MPEIVSPIDGAVAYRFEELDGDAAISALSRAEQAQRDFLSTALDQRIALCRAMLDAYATSLDGNAREITRMMGKPLSQARAEFTGGMTERVEHLCDLAPRALADHTVPPKPGFRRFIRREPVGVVLDIAAWNYPLLIAINVVVPAVLAGNAVLVKHASQTALVADQLERAFREAGAPPDLVQAFPVSHQTAAETLATRRLGYVSFTGSVRGGHEVLRATAHNNFIGVGLELGGKDGAYVAPDADLESAVENLVDGAFYNAGQSCCGIERIYVHASLYDRFVAAYVAQTHRYVVGNPLDGNTTLGPLVNPAAVQHVREQVERALAAGARVATDPSRFRVPDLSGCYLEPAVVVDVDHSMDLMHEETFGPSIGIMKVADDQAAVALMNDSAYGLTGSVWTQDDERAIALAEQVEAGTVYQNRCDYLDPRLCWTGIKDSGFGCSLSELGFQQVTRPKSFHLRLASGEQA